MRGTRLAFIVAAVLTTVLTSATPALAGSPIRPVIGCDAATNTISTSVSGGNLAPNVPVRVEFRVQYGSYATPTTQGVIPQIGNMVTVPATTRPDGTVTATGYSRPWPAGNYMFYTETVSISVKNLSGIELVGTQARCTHDLRTIVTLTCDPDAHTITATTSGTSYTQNSRVRIQYTTSTTIQGDATTPRFTSHNTMPPDFTHSATVSGGGWSDLGYVHTFSGPYYYLSETLTVTVIDQFGYPVIGRGEATCVYVDQSRR